MKHISIIAPDGQTSMSTVACIVGANQMFTEASGYHTAAGHKPAYRIEIVGVDKEADLGSGLLTIRTHTTIRQLAKTDLILIPAVPDSFDKNLEKNKLLTEWIVQQYKGGAEVASMCSGAFMLASTGLLDSKKCSTHWRFAETFKAQFPNVDLQTDMLITDEHGIYTNGGGYSFLNLVIFLIEKYFDRPTAIYCSKVFQVEIDRQSQSAFSIFSGQKLHGDDVVRQAQAYIESKLDERISTEALSARFAVGRRNFDRRFIKATGNTPTEYAQRVKIESAKKAFETSRKTIYEVMYEVGYSDLKAFRELFRRLTGLSPLEYRTKYNKEAIAGLS
ncbi:transcriptional regulator GlxA family with amidase domain [Dyadobacter sp. BE34]|uniref:Transcriptional regulator GlxA family with amidase domain n=1 Tax=Dyadobacter fermentans TaxID=94254 RepID=A0ABU1QUA1_9BACT|nr:MULTISPECIES: helix-turn-helix domain-containing protein [Dyadobacter]MDR6804748.1 transcriptional regulator GlxA family with amidase domain [Dyadobacter fermentans]MDR7043493.1 transcriptional regulator GlxA family with amidase domain [Dyadobacter sp. BE242]MDR7197805.1 transcriptional regulator GlxA family with amidase domain [Dyadobacter sp. BE34]MDR7214762.1 transcriptional regulator GlxA family with amidase domain [Dyadobacter sp. BE31]MDR7262297.1 transcriptional regulator GlxA family